MSAHFYLLGSTLSKCQLTRVILSESFLTTNKVHLCLVFKKKWWNIGNTPGPFSFPRKSIYRPFAISAFTSQSNKIHPNQTKLLCTLRKSMLSKETIASSSYNNKSGQMASSHFRPKLCPPFLKKYQLLVHNLAYLSVPSPLCYVLINYYYFSSHARWWAKKILCE